MSGTDECDALFLSLEQQLGIDICRIYSHAHWEEAVCLLEIDGYLGCIWLHARLLSLS
jgi:hypothetical protein